MNQKSNLSRRQFIKLTMTGSTGLVLGFRLPALPEIAAQDTIFEPNAYLSIDTDGLVTIMIFHSEMGQGAQTAIPMIVAEELEADWSMIRAEQAPPNSTYGDQLTGGSGTISESYRILRQAGSTARFMLLTAAAQIWDVNVETCYAENGVVIHELTGQQLSYGDLVETAATLPVPRSVGDFMKDPADFRIIGTRMGQIDNPDFVTGRTIYGSDIQLPGMLVATVARSPVFDGWVADFDSTAAQEVEGVQFVIPISRGIAVVAENTWAALQGRQALEITWDEGDWSGLNSEQIQEMFTEEIDALRSGDPNQIERVYEIAYQAHATMEPMTCTADVREGRCDVWASTQARQAAKRIARSITGLPNDAVHIHVPRIGCGCGRRLQVDEVAEAVEISEAIGAPVKVFWTRADDIHHDFYNPGCHHLMRAELGEDGLPTYIDHRIVGQSVSSTMGSEMAYSVRHTVRERAQRLPMPVGPWRAVGNNSNAFANECFIDELASINDSDPFEFRMTMLSDRSRMKPVLELATDAADWGSPLPDGWGRGIACHSTWNVTPVAQVVELSVAEDGHVRVHRVVCTIDCGVAVNPDMVEAQMEGGIVFGLTAALKTEITFEHGRTQQSNLHNVPLLRFDEMPIIEVYVIPSDRPPSGVGEMGVPPIAPAVANAIFAATGKRIRRLPIRPSDLTG